MRQLPRAMGLADLVLFYVVTTFSLRWIAAAAAVGPGAIALWVLACLAMFVPLLLCVVDLGARFPREGGLYVWSREAFGPFAGFLAAWTYWTSNLVYFPSLLYFAAGNLLLAGGRSWRAESASRGWFVAVSLIGLGIAVLPNLLGLRIGRRLHNLGAVAGWVPALMLMALGGAAWLRSGSVTDLGGMGLLPGGGVRHLALWSTMAFAFIGVEAASFMAEEIRDPQRSIPRAGLAAGVIVTALYVAGTLSILVALPPREVSGLAGIMQAITAMASRAGLDGLGGVAAALITLNTLGAVAAWFAAVARLPFVAGLDRRVPAVLGRVHPRWGTPHVAILAQAGISGLLVLLSQAGTTVEGAYQVLVGMTIVTTFVPFLFLFAAAFRLTRRRLPAVVGFLTSASAIPLAVVPEAGAGGEHSALKIVGLSLVLIAAGSALYAAGRTTTSSSPD